MSRSSIDRAIHDQVDRLAAGLVDIARSIVRDALEAELARRVSRARQVPGPKRVVGRRVGNRGAPNHQSSPEPVAIPAPGKATWTREAVLDELSTWLLGGTSDAAFISRHGRRGLARNAKRFFGRFEAALNAANLELAKRYPDGIPSSKTR